MSQISRVFKPGRKALIAYLTVGYPSLEATLKAVPLIAEAGCDMVELGIPFSDPMADGVTIQRASFTALKNGVTPALCLEIAGQIHKKIDTPLLFMTYFNIIYSYGPEEFCQKASRAGVSGLIIPDLPPEEGTELEGPAREAGIDIIYFLAPTSTDERIRLVGEKSSGFIYLTSVSGVTGAREKLPEELPQFIKKVKDITGKLVCVGFGISSPKQAAEVARLADGVIIGSRLLEILSSEGYPALEEFVKKTREAIDNI